MTTKRKIVYISGTRADYGLMKSTLQKIEESGLGVEIIATGMHLMPEFGLTVDEIKSDSFDVHEINATYEKDSRESTARFLGSLVVKLVDKIQEIRPDFILLLGDRAEMLGGAIVGSYLYIPVAHVHGGDVSTTVDEVARHAITKLSHIHFPATPKSADRIIKMGEDPWRVHVVGAPGLDSIVNAKPLQKEELFRKFELDEGKRTILVLQHPTSLDFSRAGEEMEETLSVVKEFCQASNCQCIVIYPNSDAGGRSMIKVIEAYGGLPFFKIFKNLSRSDFLGLMSCVDVMVGNSSSGIIEAPSFHLPVVNIGARQEGRERSDNVVEVNPGKEEIKKAIAKALGDRKFIERVKRCANPYGDGRTGTRIADVLKNVAVNEKLIQKRLTY